MSLVQSTLEAIVEFSWVLVVIYCLILCVCLCVVFDLLVGMVHRGVCVELDCLTNL